MPGRFAAFRKRFAISKDEMIKADSKWTKLCTYTTAKKVKIVNAKVALFHKGMILAIIGYILANLVASFGYMKVEAPFGSTNAYISDSTWSTTQATLKANNPIYCGGGTSCSGTDSPARIRRTTTRTARTTCTTRTTASTTWTSGTC